MDLARENDGTAPSLHLVNLFANGKQSLPFHHVYELCVSMQMLRERKVVYNGSAEYSFLLFVKRIHWALLSNSNIWL